MYWTTALLLLLLPQSVSSGAAYEDDSERYTAFPMRKKPSKKKQQSPLDIAVPVQRQRAPSNYLSTGSECRIYHWSQYPKREVYELSIKPNVTSGQDDAKVYYTSEDGSLKGVVVRGLNSTDYCGQHLLSTMEAYATRALRPDNSAGTAESIYQQLKPKAQRQVYSEFKELWDERTIDGSTTSVLLPYGTLTIVTKHVLVSYIDRKMRDRGPSKAGLKCTFGVGAEDRSEPMLTLGIATDFSLHSISSPALSGIPDLEGHVHALSLLPPATGVSGIPDPSYDDSPRRVTDTLCEQAFVEYLMTFRAYRAAGPTEPLTVNVRNDIIGDGGLFEVRRTSKMAAVLRDIERHLLRKIKPTSSPETTEEPPPVPPRPGRRGANNK